MSADRLVRPRKDAPHQPAFTLGRVQRLLQISVALIALVFGSQSLMIALGSGSGLPPVLGEVVVTVTHAVLAGVVVAGFIGRGASIANGTFAVVFVIVLVLWPFFATSDDPSYHPWTWFLCSLAVGCAVQAWNLTVAAVYVAVTSLGYGIDQLIVLPQSEIATTTALLDTSYALVMGYLIVTLWLLFRTAAMTLDSTRTAALVRYDEAVRQDAISAERIAVDALVHDSVLAALQTAARADDERSGRAARTMAARAIAVLVSAPTAERPELGQQMTAAGLIAALRVRVGAIAPDVTLIDERTVDARAIPRDAGEALVRAAAQALSNSVEHAGAGDVARSVVVRANARSVRVIVSDNGAGFEPTTVDPRRLGLRVSIIERMAVFGGEVALRTEPGQGTRIEMRWPTRDESDQR